MLDFFNVRLWLWSAHVAFHKADPSLSGRLDLTGECVLPNRTLDPHSLDKRVLDLIEVRCSVFQRMLLLVVLTDHNHGLELIGCWFIRELLLEGAVLAANRGEITETMLLTFVSIVLIIESGVFNNDKVIKFFCQTNRSGVGTEQSSPTEQEVTNRGL